MSVFTNVDLPTPEEPTNATVWPGCSHGSNAAAAVASIALTAMTAAVVPNAFASSMNGSGLSH